MTNRYRNTRSISAGKARRETEWIAGTANWQSVSGPSAQAIISFTQADLSEFVPFTIVRTVGLLTTAINKDFILNQEYFGAAGLVVVRQAAGANLPDPMTNVGDDTWFYHQFVGGQEEASSGVDTVSNIQWPIDSKAMRKVVDGDAIRFMFELLSGDGCELAVGFRMLLKLH